MDAGHASSTAKDYFRRLRPFQIDRGATCEPPEELRGSYDYPSGHTTRGWIWATLLAELMPDRSTALLARGRAYGESRIVCGVHNLSAVDAGRLTAAATLAAIHSKPAFQVDLAAARQELSSRRPATLPREAARCAAEAAALRQPDLRSPSTRRLAGPRRATLTATRDLPIPRLGATRLERVATPGDR